MKYDNLTLITLNNTLHIKADNLEAVEVDKEHQLEISKLAYENFCKKGGHPFNYMDNLKSKFINISELSDRIEVRWGTIDLGLEGMYGNSEYRAFLLPEKENKCDATCADNECIWDDLQECLEIVDKKSYTIEEIEKAIDKTFPHEYGKKVKMKIIYNLKK